MLWLWIMGCAEQAPEPVQEPEPVAAAMPSADEVLQRHVTGTNQCKLLTAKNYLLRWDTVVTNGGALGYGERVIQQGTQGTSFSRIHERVKPNWSFSAVGRTPEGRYWSASDAGIVNNIEGEAVTAQIMQNLDPTPLCEFDKRWSKREVLGEEEHAGVPCWHLQLTWNDGTQTQAWFSKEEGTLRGMLTTGPDFEQRRGFSGYKDFDGIFWPEEEKLMTRRGEETLISISKLLGLAIDSEALQPLTPENLQAMLEKKRAEGVLEGPGVEKK